MIDTLGKWLCFIGMSMGILGVFLMLVALMLMSIDV